ncbi:GntR family transcriptional regulator [Amycolatopsis orientalis]|uniref:GntR family transcriptional regulator n=1 Tax=Amycolatopsis orientalis TaxID=31958 RepID=UPI0009DC3781|nr:UTRA domain-containing protein [Amycolatopsis orientalis]
MGSMVDSVQPGGNIQRNSPSRLSRAARAKNRAAFLADAEGSGFIPSASVEVRFERADARVAQKLAIDEGAEVTVRDRVLRADGRVVQLSVSRLPRELTRGTGVEEADTGPGGTYARLEEAGHPPASFVEQVGARMPTAAERALLPAGAPVLTVTRVALKEDGSPLEVNDMVLVADRYQLSYAWLAD